MNDEGRRIHVALHGASGRMGQAVLRAARQCDMVISAALVRPGSALIDVPLRQILGESVGELEFRAALDPDVTVDALVDFSGPHAFDAALALALERRAAFVSGTTGLSPHQLGEMHRASAAIPVLWTSNFSLGVALMRRFARVAARVLPDWDCEIVEMHHRRKADAPSGTALTLGEAVAEGRGLALDEVAAHGRCGQTGARPPGQIGFHALRGGDVVGEHTVIFASDDERIEFTHRAANREIFARGALLAARWLAAAKPGRYDMDDVLGD
ncbi:MAG TPA: 4-hydroxy-tetrahydrodipicolinate reductase [Tahibacter sp.]|uniref:4-hydroxy-tetrahydrodipicolinate reductase n=1 Tax=Tahibacter sp. TaxID=2056211 RepID=UPI002CBF33DF|nr:4-hydroxy-tetrahydrodipicolinate reductase [Tahibacter sp.]HSX63016.1 4-hydroxy-tetrahydrodipicolinate reductase [Tahibacter sp.]